VRAKLPELPDQKAARFESEYGLSAYDARHLVEHRNTTQFFEACMACVAEGSEGSVGSVGVNSGASAVPEAQPSGAAESAGIRDAEGVTGEGAPALAKPLANLAINDIAAWANANPGTDIMQCALTPARAVELVKLTADGKISSKQSKEVFAAVLEEDKDPAAIVAERGLEQVSDTGAIEAVVDQVIADNPDKVEAYRGGKTGLMGFFVGQCMKATQGKGNPQLINQLLSQKLG
jgi:aspartyl-tRNA(Asn)/glutamyl-tRNA(Gln) amidotransferase subunit B